MCLYNFDVKWYAFLLFCLSIYMTLVWYTMLQPLRAVVLGPPASGKTTVIQQLCQFYKLHHIKIKDVIDEGIEQLVCIIHLVWFHSVVGCCLCSITDKRQRIFCPLSANFEICKIQLLIIFYYYLMKIWSVGFFEENSFNGTDWRQGDDESIFYCLKGEF